MGFWKEEVVKLKGLFAPKVEWVKKEPAAQPQQASAPAKPQQTLPTAPSPFAMVTAEAEPEWALRPPRCVILNIRISPTWAMRLKEVGIPTEERDRAAQTIKNIHHVREAIQHGLDPMRLKRKDHAGFKQVDSGIQIRFTSQRLEDMLCIDRLGYDLIRRHGMTFTGCWMVKKQGDQKRNDQMFSLRLRFESHRDSGEQLFDFFGFYQNEMLTQYTVHPEDVRKDKIAMDEAIEDVAELKRILDILLQRLYHFVTLFKNPNQSWTVNSGKALDIQGAGNSTPQVFNRLRLVEGWAWMLNSVPMPTQRQSSIEPRRRPVRKPISQTQEQPVEA